MAEFPPLYLPETTPKQRESSRRLSLVEDLPPVLKIERMALLESEPTTATRRLSAENDIKLRRRKDSEPERLLHNESNPATAQGHTKPKVNRSKPPTADSEECKLTRKISEATFPVHFPELTTFRCKFSKSHDQYISNEMQNVELFSIMWQLQFMPPLEYLHQCMPVSYYLKGPPLTINDPSEAFQHRNCILPPLCQDHYLHPVLPPPASCQTKRERQQCEFTTKMQTLSSSKSYPTSKIVKKVPHKPIPINNLSKGIPKVSG